MARPLRIEYPGAFYHVISRGNARQKIFLDEADKEKFMCYLETGVEQFCYMVHAYCLMDNHYHLLLETRFANLGRLLQRLNSSYTTYFSRRRRRPGHVLQGRPKVLLVEKDAYALELSRYIHLNAVKAGIVRRPEDYPWSSYPYYIQNISPPDYLETSLVLGQLDPRNRVARRSMREFVKEGITRKLQDPFNAVQGRTILGRDPFVQWVRKKFIKDRAKERELPAIRELKRLELPEIREKVKDVFRGEPKLARKVTIYLCRKYSERSLGEIGDFIGGLSVSAVSQTVRRLDALRAADKRFDRRLKSLERRVKMSNV